MGFAYRSVKTLGIKGLWTNSYEVDHKWPSKLP